MQGMIELGQTENGERSAEHLGTLLRQVSKASMGEIESLIVELKTLHKKLQTDGDRIQRDRERCAELSSRRFYFKSTHFRTVGRAASLLAVIISRQL